MGSEHTCYKCGAPVSLDSSNRIGFRESCASCAADLHCCRNCGFYDRSSYNECRETSADRVVDKDRANRCDYFAYASRSGPAAKNTATDTAKKKLDDLFKQ